MMIVVNVMLVLDCPACKGADAVNELLRDRQRSFNPESCLLDYAICSPAVQVEDDDADTSCYVEGEAFRSL
ncbi:hypothetical protein [Burkholderia sp. MBR-1]|uniref:hypothetical protein n=1 Tax=Burkholderia sp. MBR-1 TaxID=2732364 RepID=UPI0015EEA754|nr:hypothetical protein [Burkholderia sp. MBR-1]QMI49721.1 hypothetical protein MBR110_30060 [Burkholderia sp. MBR-1]